MLINLDDFRRKKQNKANAIQLTNVPVFNRILVENNKLIGELIGSKEKVIIEHLEQKTNKRTF
ncbi:hypothetical protein ACRS52_06440 [Bacillus cytotoxicus]|uniref:Uncharacterized protein n=1 Tax=Bacillus cytotoxicus TaxID=580165 RepID=A0AAX2CNN8_9BACI|nr:MULTISPECIES: hypothetical protein [Bacillus cereus group]QTR81194.1 hypothetical protein JC777_00725 [Bacillus cytotoxicus]SCM08034.1 Uncharacterized protein BCB44BAC_04519 [Bacillus cytotoxicus]